MNNTSSQIPPVQNQNPAMNPNVPRFEQPGKPRSSAPAIALIALVIVAILAALYFWGMSLNTSRTAETTDGTGAETELSTSASTNLDDIERDLDSADIDNADREIVQIEAEFE